MKPTRTEIELKAAEYDDLCAKTRLTNGAIARAMGVTSRLIRLRRRSVSPLRREHLLAMRTLARKMERAREQVTEG